MIATKTMGANVLSQNNKSCTGGEATKKREIPAQQKQGEIQVKIIALAAAVIVGSFPQASVTNRAAQNFDRLAKLDRHRARGLRL
jgi:hypothetical protein